MSTVLDTPQPKQSADHVVARARIEVLHATTADQIAAGEVVERPASVVKELVDNAIDAGATRIEVELFDGGMQRIVVRDDGGGIHPEDLELALRRHATSKLRRAEELLDIVTLGFRGEALASIAAVADVTLESRPADETTGTRVLSRPGVPLESEPVGMALGTRIEVRGLFARVPARRKFMRSEATEVGHCSDAIIRAALVHPGIHFRLAHQGRQLLDFRAAPLPERIAAVVSRRVRSPLHPVESMHDDIKVRGWFAGPDTHLRSPDGVYIVVRRRVVRERNLRKIVAGAYGDLLPAGRHPVACLIVEPPAGAVDVNVHPQKVEVRFAEPQRVYAAVRAALEGVASSLRPSAVAESPPAVASFRIDVPQGMSTGGWAPASTASSGRSEGTRARDDSPAARYRLRTRATADDYRMQRQALHQEAQTFRRDRAEPMGAADALPGTVVEPPTQPAAPPEPALLTCLPGPVALMRWNDELLVVHLRRLRAYLIYQRMLADFGGGAVPSQGLLSPVVIKRPACEVALCVDHAEALAKLGLRIEAFGDDALIVRGVPAHLRNCVDDPDLHGLVERILPWLRVQGSARQPDPGGALKAIAQTSGSDPAPRLARRWVATLVAQGEDLSTIDGIARYTGEQLVP